MIRNMFEKKQLIHGLTLLTPHKQRVTSPSLEGSRLFSHFDVLSEADQTAHATLLLGDEAFPIETTESHSDALLRSLDSNGDDGNLPVKQCVN